MTNYAEFVEFDDYDDNDDQIVLNFNTKSTIPPTKPKTEQVELYGYNIKYNKQTMEYYRVIRKLKIDPFSRCELYNNYFEYPYMWDPYIGEKLNMDPNGPLCFDPDQLIKYFYYHRLDNLWIDPKDDFINNSNSNSNAYFEGHYGDGVGGGDTFYIASRGNHPERYLFRVPIIDCYLTDDHNNQIVTFGPKLTDSDVETIDRLAHNLGSNYRNIFFRDRPSLKEMKKWYDMAISKTPETFTDMFKSKGDREKANRYAVDQLRKMKG